MNEVILIQVALIEVINGITIIRSIPKIGSKIENVITAVNVKLSLEGEIMTILYNPIEYYNCIRSTYPCELFIPESEIHKYEGEYSRSSCGSGYSSYSGFVWDKLPGCEKKIITNHFNLQL